MSPSPFGCHHDGRSRVRHRPRGPPFGKPSHRPKCAISPPEGRRRIGSTARMVRLIRIRHNLSSVSGDRKSFPPAVSRVHDSTVVTSFGRRVTLKHGLVRRVIILSPSANPAPVTQFVAGPCGPSGADAAWRGRFERHPGRLNRPNTSTNQTPHRLTRIVMLFPPTTDGRTMPSEPSRVDCTNPGVHTRTVRFGFFCSA